MYFYTKDKRFLADSNVYDFGHFIYCVRYHKNIRFCKIENEIQTKFKYRRNYLTIRLYFICIYK
jgi:hypothetical protein